MKAVVAALNQEKALVGAFSVITNLRMELFEALGETGQAVQPPPRRNNHIDIATNISNHTYCGIFVGHWVDSRYNYSRPHVDIFTDQKC